MYFIGDCGAQIEIYEDPDREIIVQCAMGRTMCSNDGNIEPCEICYDCSMTKLT